MDNGKPLRKRKYFSVNQPIRPADTDDEPCGGETFKDATDTELYRVWYRHSGQPRIKKIPAYGSLVKEMHLAEILEDTKENDITHMKLEGTVIPSLHEVAPRLQELKIKNLIDSTQLDRLATLTQLKELDLSLNDFYNGLPQVVGKLSSLTVLKLEGCKLTDLPDNLSSLTHLRELNLSNNSFHTGFPQAIGQLSSLTVLNLSRCHLRKLPDRLAALTRLRELDLSWNDFSKRLPEVIGKLSSLTVLDLWTCQLKELPYILATLTQLKELDLSWNDFSNGLPQVIEELNGLTVLNLAVCKLGHLSDKLSQLSSLKELNLHNNDFEEFPSVIFALQSLKTLDISSNGRLETIRNDILLLVNLIELKCDDCTALHYPPYAVCEQGISAMRQYLTDVRSAHFGNLTMVSAAIVGQQLAGKTSLVKTLQKGIRSLTARIESSPMDAITRVFDVNELKLHNTRARLILHDSHQIHHSAFQYLCNAQNVPLVVVNLVEFRSLVYTSDLKEATKTTCWDWLSHLYLSSPSLGPPILVLTHADKLSSDDVTWCKGEILREAKVIKQEMLAEDIEQFGQQQSQLNQILHLSNKQIPIFYDDDIFVFGNDESETSNIKALKENLDRRCLKFTRKIPQFWEDVCRFISDQLHKPFIALSDVTSRYPSDDCLSILRYLHNAGDILWFEHVPSLKRYIFHQIQNMTKMITVLCDHRSEEEWKRRLDAFTAYRHGEEMIEKEEFKQMIKEFGSSGVIDEALLIHLLKSETKFPPDVALELLQCFNIVHGSIGQGKNSVYAIPCLVSLDMGKSWETYDRLQLRLDIELGGLSLPMYGYQLATVAVLDKMMSPVNNYAVARNGVTVYHGLCATHLIHSFEKRNITLQVSTEVKQLGDSWKNLLKTSKDIIELLSNTWITCRPFVRVYCSHCLFLRDPHPGYRVNPVWFHPISKRSPTDKACTDVDNVRFSGMGPVNCIKHAACNMNEKPSVPKPLLFPCYQLTADDINKVDSYLTRMEPKRFRKPPERVQRPLRPQPTDDEDSELSDSLEYLDETDGSLEIISMRVEPCAKAGIRELYFSDLVYRMSAPTRGRCLIINNMNFGGNVKHVGSDKDVKNISDVFDRLSFQCFVQKELSSQQMLEVIEKETELSAHKDFGMFVLVIMTPGLEKNLYGSDDKVVERTRINDILSAQKFPAMAGKPKLIILEACSGTRYDTAGGPTVTHSSTSATQQSTSSQPLSTHTSPSLTISVPPVPAADCLAGDDLFIMRASFSGYRSVRSSSHGSWFIRALVEALYKHSCHKDIRTLFEKQITKKVRKKSKSTNMTFPRVTRQQPTIECQHTKGRKLYLFPGYNPPSQ